MKYIERLTRGGSALRRRALLAGSVLILAITGAVLAAGPAQAAGCGTYPREVCISRDGSGGPSEGIAWDEDCLAGYYWGGTSSLQNDSITRASNYYTFNGGIHTDFYEHCWYGGANYYMGPGTGVNFSGTWWNDRISSWDLAGFN
jgi:hypothetical protein